MKKNILIIFLFSLIPASIFAFTNIKDFKFYKNIDGDCKTSCYIDLDQEVESKVGFLSNLRIFNDKDEVQYKIIQDKDIVTKKIENIDLKIVSKNNKTIIIDLDNNTKDDYLNQIYIETNSVDFRKSFAIYGNDILNNSWKRINLETRRGDLVYLLPEGEDLSLDFQFSNYKYLKIINLGGEGDLEILGFYKKKNIIDRIEGEKDSLNASFKFLENDEKNTDLILLDLQKENLFFEQIKIKFNNKRFERKYELYTSNNDKAEFLDSDKRFDDNKDYWIKISNGFLSKESYTGDPVLNIHQNKRFYLLKIYNEDNHSLSFYEAKFTRFKKKIYFKNNFKKENDVLRIYYSSDKKIDFPKYDFILSKKELENAKKLKLSSEKINNEYKNVTKVNLSNNMVLLYILIFVIVLILGFFVLKILREAKNKTEKKELPF